MISTIITPRRSVWTALISILAAACMVGCGGAVAVTGGGGGGGDAEPDNDGGSGGGAGQDEISVRFINDSDAAIDTQFYATNDVLDDPGEDLFQPQYHIEADIGVAGSGLLDVDADDEITFPCSDNTVIGTEGGEYYDSSGALLATGQRRILSVGDNFDCGNTIIFAYIGSNGEYTTEPPVVDSR
ncbi:MAG TPA: hypothetical protein VM243_03745 [Phycisphaerae bacterium]|nr:hypothetical protein [Phycisphaerae bacterium]